MGNLLKKIDWPQLWARFSTAVTLVSLISIVDQLRAWAELLTWLAVHAPNFIAFTIEIIADLLRWILTPWHLLGQWVLGLLPWDLPSWAFSAFTLLAMATSASVRALLLKWGLSRAMAKIWAQAIDIRTNFWSRGGVVKDYQAELNYRLLKARRPMEAEYYRREELAARTMAWSYGGVVVAILLLTFDYALFSHI